MKKGFQFYKQLFMATFSISAFTFGGGYVIVPLMKKKFCDTLHWIEEDEMLDMITISQSLPGPMAVDASVLVGYRLAGIKGAATAFLATVLPPLVILSVVSLFYEMFETNQVVKAVLGGMQAGIAAVIADVVVSGVLKNIRSKEAVSIAVMIAAFCAIFFFQVNVMWIILICGVLGGLTAVFGRKKAKP